MKAQHGFRVWANRELAGVKRGNTPGAEPRKLVAGEWPGPADTSEKGTK